MEFEGLRQAVWEANIALWKSGVVLFTWGNVSGCDRERGLVAIKPSGIAYDVLRPEDIVVVDLMSGDTVAGECRPSSDTPTHLALYRGLADIAGVVHTHSPCATAFAQAQRPIPPLGTTHADVFFGDVPITRMLTDEEIEAAYERNTGAVILEALQGLEPLAMPAVLVAGHGPFTWSNTPTQAVEHAVILESVAHMALMTLSLRPGQAPLPDVLMRKHYERKHGAQAYYGQVN